MDAVSEARLQLICPVLSAKIHSLAMMLADETIVFRVTQGLRSWNDQQALWLQGRDINGNVVDATKIVTNARPGYSWHEFGLAVDVVPMDQVPPQPDWNINHPQWQRIITVGESLGLYSGSEFIHSPKDNPHFQLTGIFPVTPNDECRQILLNAGMQAVWQESGLMAEQSLQT
jgi:peptidoglycan L-alanyl-D-glutamate endopeptidase CwlK